MPTSAQLTRRASTGIAVTVLVLVVGIALALPLLLSSTEGGDGASVPSLPAPAAGHPGHAHGASAAGSGLRAEATGHRLVPLTREVAAGKPSAFRFRIERAGGDSDGTVVKSFAAEQTKLMHVYVVRSDLTGYRHVHPAMAADGTWSVALGPPEPGWWRLYASFLPEGGKEALVLSVPYRVPGSVTPEPVPRPSLTAETDGYTLALSGDPITAGRAGSMVMTITKDGEPVTGLRPYLGAYAHVSGFREGNGAFAHMHPNEKVHGAGGPRLTLHALLPDAGMWRLFVQFITGGKLHTAAVTVRAGEHAGHSSP